MFQTLKVVSNSIAYSKCPDFLVLLNGVLKEICTPYSKPFLKIWMSGGNSKIKLIGPGLIAAGPGEAMTSA